MKELQKAMNDFSEVVKKATGGYSTFSRESGAWERQLPPNQIASFDHPSDETIIVKEGSLVVLYRKAKIFLHAGASAVIKGGEPHQVVAGSDGAKFQVKYSW